MAVKPGDTVAVHYTGKLDSGEVFDSNEGGDPLRFRVGDHRVIAGFEQAVQGLGMGESITVRIPPEQAYGERREDLILTLPRNLFEGGDLEAGQEVELEDEDGNNYVAHVLDFTDDEVTVDLNHPLAGETLTFDVRVVEIG